MKVLHIDSSALGDFSASRQMSAATLQAIRSVEPEVVVTYRDLGANPPPHLSGGLLAVMRPQPNSPTPSKAVQADAALSEELLQEFLAADLLVLGAPMYNFSIPSPLKPWIDRIAQAGRTFRYTANGPEGLAGGKTVIVLSSRGSLIGGSPYEVQLDHQESYLKAVFGFFGITDIRIVRAEGLGLGAEGREKSVKAAMEQIGAMGDQVVAIA